MLNSRVGNSFRTLLKCPRAPHEGQQSKTSSSVEFEGGWREGAAKQHNRAPMTIKCLVHLSQGHGGRGVNAAA